MKSVNILIIQRIGIIIQKTVSLIGLKKKAVEQRTYVILKLYNNNNFDGEKK